VVAALEQIDAERGISLSGEPLADAADVVVEPRGLMDDDYARIRSRPVRKSQIGSVEGLVLIAPVSASGLRPAGAFRPSEEDRMS
jgi:hypothetical protein